MDTVEFNSYLFDLSSSELITSRLTVGTTTKNKTVRVDTKRITDEHDDRL